MNVLIAISIIIFSLGVILIEWKLGNPDSLSETFYLIGGQAKQWAFMLFFIGFTLPFMMASEHALQFIAGGLLWWVSAAAAYKEEGITGTVHYLAAVGSIVCGFLLLIIFYKLWIPVLLFFVIWFIIGDEVENRKTWYVELSAFYVIAISLLFAIK